MVEPWVPQQHLLVGCGRVLGDLDVQGSHVSKRLGNNPQPSFISRGITHILGAEKKNFMNFMGTWGPFRVHEMDDYIDLHLPYKFTIHVGKYIPFPIGWAMGF